MTVEAVELSLQEREFCQPPTRWLLVLFTGLIMFGNHYARDAVGALEIQIESDLLISSDQYATINSIYFFPSIVAPLLAGVFTNYIGGAGKCLLYGVISSSIGHVIFSIGIEVGNIYLVFLGRAISGFMYEIIDSLPIVILAPLFDSQWGLVVGLLNGFLRLGSVMNFVLSPVIYKTRGVKVALWFATAIATSAVLFAALAYSLTRKKEMLDGKKYEQLDGSNHIELNVLCPEQDEEGEGDWLGDTEGERNVLHKDHRDEVLHDTHIMSRNTTTPVPVKIVNSTLAVPSVTSPIGIASGPMISSSAHLTRSDEENPSDQFSAVSMDKNLIVLSTGTVRGRILSALPLHLFGYQFYMFLCTGACLYGSMVPFWFLGSKFLQDCYSLTVGQADGLMLLPEGMIALVSVPIGMLLDSYNCTTKLRLQLLAASCLLLPLSYSMLALGYRISIQEHAADSQVRSSSQTLISPYLTMFCIGTAYAVSNSLYWSTIMDVLPKGRYFSSANGLTASCLNILPSVVPTILALAASIFSTQEDILRSLPMFVLSFIGICAAGFSFLASLGTKISSIQSDD